IQLVQQQGLWNTGTLFRTEASWRDCSSSPQLRTDPRDHERKGTVVHTGRSRLTAVAKFRATRGTTATESREKSAMKTFASSGHKFGQLKIYGAGMAISKSRIRSRHRCPDCGSPLFYVDTAF